MSRLLVYLKDYKKECIFAPLFKMLEALFELFVPLVMAAVIDTGIANSDKPYIIKMCLVLVLLAVVGLTSSITAQFLLPKLRPVLQQNFAMPCLSTFRVSPSLNLILSAHQHL